MVALAACQTGPGTDNPPIPPGTAPSRPASIASLPPRTGGPAGMATGDRANRPRPTDPFVALLLPLSGQLAPVGRDLLDAAQMGMFDVGDADFALRPYDTAGTDTGARDAATRAVADGARLILGPLTSGSTGAAALVARPHGIRILSFSNDRHVAGEGVFTLGFLPRDQVRRIVSHAQTRGLNRFAILMPENAYGREMLAALEAATPPPAAGVTRIGTYRPGDPDLAGRVRDFARFDQRSQALAGQRNALQDRNDAISRQALARLSQRQTVGGLPFDAILLPANGREALQIAPLLAFYDVDPARIRLLGTWLWDDPGTHGNLGQEPNMLGAWLAAPPPAARASFETQFRTLYGRAPDRRATLAYDAVTLAALLARTAPPGTDPYAINVLTAPVGYAGADGIFRLLPDGLVQRGLAVLEVGPEGLLELDPAPASFDNTGPLASPAS